MWLVNLIFLAIGILFFLVLVYLYFLAAVGLLPQRRRWDPALPETKFAVVVPAHNESPVIGRTVESLRAMDYPGGGYDVFVVADNCTDDTAGVTRAMGATCWERRDTERWGKGYVLSWAFDRLLAEGDHGAFVVIDADTLVDPGFLRAMHRRIAGGAQASQGYYDVLHPERSPMESLSYLGFIISRHFRYRGRTRLGWTSNLLGNGMCFTRDVIERFGWSAASIVEDIEYEMMLMLGGVRVVFAPEARIYADIPRTFGGSEAQRGRWDIGKFAVRNRYVPLLLREGLKKRDPAYLDAALELLIPPFALFVALVAGCFALFLAVGQGGYDLAGPVWGTVMSGLALYVAAGLVLARAHARVYLNLVYAPFFILWRLWVVARGLATKVHGQWLKTQR